MLNFESFQGWSTLILCANSAYYTKCEEEHHEFDELLLETLKDRTRVLNIFFQRDNKKKNAAKSLAELALNSVSGAAERNDWAQCRKYIIEGTNNTIGALIGQETFKILMKSYKHIFLLFKKEGDLSKNNMEILVATASLQAKKELLKNNLYKGAL